MTPLSLRKVDGLHAQASRRLGPGLSLDFSAQGLDGRLTLLPLPQGVENAQDAVWLNSAIGALHLSDAEAVLSLLSHAPVALNGESQAWYWAFLNQRLSAPVAQLLAPLSLVGGPMPSGGIACRVQIRLGAQQLHASLSASPETLLRLLDSSLWLPHQTPLREDWPVVQPVIIGQLSLSLEQLASLRPGDVLLPSQIHFDSHGNGVLAVAGRHWAVHTHASEHPLSLRISHEEGVHDGQ